MERDLSNKIIQIKQGQKTAFINKDYTSNLAFKPEFVYNDHEKGKKVLASIEEELMRCEEFSISVAFITRGGVTPLLQTLKELEKKGVPGRIMTTDYLMFSDPVALEKLAELKNISLRMYHTEIAEHGFHTKGYIFKEEEIYRIIIGSSNMTLDALTKNMEWNTRIVSTDQGEMGRDIVREFDKLWNAEYTIDYEEFKGNYRERYEQKKLLDKLVAKQKQMVKAQTIPSFECYKLKPNKMQVGFISNLQKLVETGQNKALLLSATGARFILMTGRKPFENKDFGPVFSFVHRMPGVGKRGIIFLFAMTITAKKIKIANMPLQILVGR